MNTARAKRLLSSLSPVWIQPDSRLICFCKIYSLAKFLQQLGTRKRPSSAKSTSPWYYLQGTTRYWESKIHTSNLVASVTVRLWSDQGEPPVGDAEETRSVPMGGCAEAWRVRKRRRPGSGGRRRSGQWHRALSCAARCLCLVPSVTLTCTTFDNFDMLELTDLRCQKLVSEFWWGCVVSQSKCPTPHLGE